MQNPDCFIFPCSKRLIWGRPVIPERGPLGKSQDSQLVSGESGKMGVNREATVINPEIGFLECNICYLW